MKCLGIPNTTHYHDITAIQEVYALRDKLANAAQGFEFDEGVEQEFEDMEGNVFNKKTYDDLKRQGII